MGTEDKPIKVAIIGGGCAGITAAFELSRPEHRGRYQVTVYQLGWRLGGKGASGRGAADRIEEHGLHLWMGCYENAFQIMRECYAELDRDPRVCPIASWQDAFVPDNFVGLADRDARGDWLPWVANFPPAPGSPGDPLSRHNPFTVLGYMERAASLLRALLVSARQRAGEVSRERAARVHEHRTQAAEPDAASWRAGFSPENIVATVERFLMYGQLATVGALIEAVEILRSALAVFVPVAENPVLRLLDALASAVRRQLQAVIGHDDGLRRVWEVADLVLACLRGAVRFGLAFDPRGFDAINEYDWREWLQLNGASPATLDSAFLRGIYDLTLAYEDGDTDRPAMAAGPALRFAVRMFFTYRGALFWKMQAGMGDVVFAPLYEVLARRGVAFEFFHRLRDVKLADSDTSSTPHVAALEFDVQAEIRDGEAYQPLIPVHGLPCWPAAPRYEQLVDGERLEREGWHFESHWETRKAGTRTLNVGQDFDCVVLALSVGAIPHTCAELVARSPRWRAMVHNVKTVATQAFQLWLDADARELGWNEPPVNLSAFVEPFDTWADMSHLAVRESWPVTPRSIAYFCSVLAEPKGAPDDADLPGRARDQVRENAIRFLERDIGHLWPRARDAAGGFRWDLLLAPSGTRDATGPERFATQFLTANINPSDRYVLSLPGTIKYRISPLEIQFDNLTIAGDWTECGINTGCVESAVISGRLAAHALSRYPALGDIIGYDHP